MEHRSVGLGFVAAVACALRLSVPNACAQPRIVILGVDGMDHAVTREFLDAGRLPALSELAASGTFAPLVSVNPAQSPTSWASLTTGRNPGETGIFGFLRRTIRGDEIVADVALVERGTRRLVGPGEIVLFSCGAVLLAILPAWFAPRRVRRRVAVVLLVVMAAAAWWVLRQIPSSIPAPRNARGAAAFWETFPNEGVPTTALFAPLAFPARDLGNGGKALAGLGVPDLLQTPGTTVVYRSDVGAPETTVMGGRIRPLKRAVSREVGEEWFESELEGPSSLLDGRPIVVPFRVQRTSTDELALEFVERGERVRLPVGEFTDFLPLSFRMGAFFELKGLVRFRRLPSSGVAIYQEPVQIDPRQSNPIAPITWPHGFGAQLAAGGLFETLGWATATNPAQDEQIGDDVLLQDVRGLVRQRRRIFLDELKQPDWRVLFCVFSTMDRVQHLFWRDRDPEHPMHDPALAATRRPIEESYEAIDDLVRTVRAALRPEDVILVLSDHGFAPFRRAVNLNKWLAEEGYLVGRGDGRRSLESHLGKAAFATVDWSATRAYGLGLGRIWLNLVGREPHGIVQPKDAPRVMDEICQKLLALRDGERSVVRSVVRASDIYRGSRLRESADLIVGFERGYRISWAACLGGLDEPVLSSNRTRWSGDHCSVDPRLVPGVLFCNRSLRVDGEVGVLDVLPTLRRLLALPANPELEGRALE